ncbi:hypothetical protein BamMEX5DRAFT_6767 [Burkholderia ambifaria MEX-5]|uniref:Uncharacterized protein n=1 Tax=Burkholderia ambifaria MEX-5 TaxID=396597 RepID=B1TG46_9BURK|nr:hypothetical protein BamMEX5DRAFT_6767 [Burkholderia ambifaria MEX-5]
MFQIALLLTARLPTFVSCPVRFALFCKITFAELVASATTLPVKVLLSTVRLAVLPSLTSSKLPLPPIRFEPLLTVTLLTKLGTLEKSESTTIAAPLRPSTVD